MKTSKRDTYHHGGLKAALLAAARELLDEGGVNAVSVREASRRAGVTPAASYRHFTDKQALLVALAVQGFDEFAAAMKSAMSDSRNPMGHMGVAYVRFAVDHPGLFRLMFGPAVADRAQSPELLEVIGRATQFFTRGVTQREGGGGKFDPVSALRAWATVHGLATLAIDGMLPGYDPIQLAQALAKLGPASA